MERVLADAEEIQARLWRIAVERAVQDMSSDVAALYLESLNEAFSIHATRVALGLQTRIPLGIWATLGVVTFLGMCLVGYQAGVADSKRTMAMPILALVYVRLRGRWQPGPVSMGRWSGPVTYVAAAWIVAETINVAWPRHLNDQWYLNWGIIIMSAALGMIGLIISGAMFRRATRPDLGVAGPPAPPPVGRDYEIGT